MSNIWLRGTMRSPLLDLKTGEEVVAIKTTLKHTDPTLAVTWWVMSIKAKTIYQISEYMAGRRLFNMVKLGDPIPDDRQVRCTERAKTLLSQSVYAPSNAKTKTYFHIDRSSIKQRFRYEQSATS